MAYEHHHQWTGGGYEMRDVIKEPPREEARSNLAVLGRCLLFEMARDNQLSR
jgi:UTP-glucose-1-phosphate uridylyltransferase